MKLRFFIDADDPGRWNEEACDDGDYHGRASNMYINNRHPHEHQTLKEVFYDEFSKYCTGSTNKSLGTVLIDLPDEVMFQYMMDGFNDYNFLVYNTYTENIAIGNDLEETCNEAYRTTNDTRNRGYTKGHAFEDNLIFDWNLNYRTADFVDEDNVKKIDGEFYSLVLKEIKPYIQHWYTQKVHMIHNILEDIIRKEGRVASPNIYYEDEAPVPEDSYGRKFKAGIDIRSTGLYFVFNQYCNDGEFFLGGREYFNDYHLETLRLMWQYCHNKSTKASEISPKNGTDK